jgi:hypothetical protein
MWLVRVETRTACFGMVVDGGGVVVRAAPMTRWAIGKPGKAAVAWWRKHGATVTWSHCD